MTCLLRRRAGCGLVGGQCIGVWAYRRGNVRGSEFRVQSSGFPLIPKKSFFFSLSLSLSLRSLHCNSCDSVFPRGFVLCFVSGKTSPCGTAPRVIPRHCIQGLRPVRLFSLRWTRVSLLPRPIGPQRQPVVGPSTIQSTEKRDFSRTVAAVVRRIS